MILKTLGTYNALWMMTVAEAHRQAAERKQRLRVLVNGNYPIIVRTVPGPITLKDVR